MIFFVFGAVFAMVLAVVLSMMHATGQFIFAELSIII